MLCRCDLKYDCVDHSDEVNCQLVKFPEGEFFLAMKKTFKGALNWASMMSRDASLSDSYKFDRC